MIIDKKIKGHIECIGGAGEGRVRNIAEAANSTFCNIQRYTLLILKFPIWTKGLGAIGQWNFLFPIKKDMLIAG